MIYFNSKFAPDAVRVTLSSLIGGKFAGICTWSSAPIVSVRVNLLFTYSNGIERMFVHSAVAVMGMAATAAPMRNFFT
jgi:hypothetical protein